MTSETPNPKPSQDQMWHTTIGSPENPPLLLLHGLTSSHNGFKPLTPFLQKHFYLILVDLPGHSNSRSPALNSLRLPQIVDRLVTLIKEVSPTGRTHIAGLSWGSFIALDLARQHPELIESLFASGAPPFEGKEAFAASRPWIIRIINGLTTSVPDSVFWWMCRQAGVPPHPELRKEMLENSTRELIENAHADILTVTLKRVGEITGVRIAAVAGGKQDNVDVTRRMGIALRKAGGEECKAFVVRKAIHAWDLQFPELFAKGIISWVKETEMPEEFEELK